MIATIGVVGTGTMGSGIAQAFAQAGYTVRMQDADASALARARKTIEHSLGKLREKNVVTAAVRDAALQNLVPTADLTDLADVDFVIEAIAEDAGAKCALFQTLDTLTRSTVVLATNTSSISIGTIAAATSRPGCVVGMHFMNPVVLIPLVEIVRGAATSHGAVLTATTLAHALDKTPVEAADRPGFIANRVLMPMINEAVRALEDGAGSAEAIDAVMKIGMRHPMGPLALADLIGLDVCEAILKVMQDGLVSEHYAPAKLLCDKVAAGHLGRKTGQGFYSYPR